MTKPVTEKGNGIFVDMLIDGNFKLIFSNPANKQILVSLLNEVMPSKITDLRLAMQEKRGRQIQLKSSVFDLDCELSDGRTVVVEVQFNSRADYLDRMLYYSTWPISSQKLVSENNYTLKDVYVVSFCNFSLEHDKDWDDNKVVSSYTIREDSNGEIMTNALHFVYVELGRFTKERGELKSQLENFLYYLKNMSRLKEVPENISYKSVNEMVKAAVVESLSPEDRTLYDKNMRNEFDLRTEKLMAREEARAEGLAEGRTAGLAEGRTAGMEIGRAEGKEERSIEIAQTMKNLGIDINTIVKSTGLSEAEIKAL